MNRTKLNLILKEVVREAQELKIPVPDHIHDEVLMNPRPKKRFGCCRNKGGKFQIEISKFVLECDERAIRSIIAHEILHTCKGCQNHGTSWKKYAEKMNQAYGYHIKRVSSFEEMGLESASEEDRKEKIRYIIKCTSCGEEYPRQRFTCVMRKINAYRCQCGGKLILITKEKG